MSIIFQLRRGLFTKSHDKRVVASEDWYFIRHPLAEIRCVDASV